LYIHRLGSTMFYGQCSEICGVNHGFMPIKINSDILNWWEIWANKDHPFSTIFNK
jgi:heme/copper-type cytochrome/quinol oxidase subunit 2